MLKKIMATVLAGALALALSVPVFAAPAAGSVGSSSDVSATNSSSDELTVDVDAKANLPTLNLTITGKPGIILNPYGLKTGIDEALAASSSTGGYGNKGNQVVGAPITIANASGVPVAVGATFSTTASGITFSNKATIADTVTTKTMFLALSAGATLADAQNRDDFTKGNFLGSLIATANEVTQANLWLIDNGKTGYFTFVGSMTKAPAEAWAESDDFKIDLTMNFRLSMPTSTT